MNDGNLANRYTITHKDGKPIDPEKFYLVLELSPAPDERERAGIEAFAEACERTGYTELAASIRAQLPAGKREITVFAYRRNDGGYAATAGDGQREYESWWGPTLDDLTNSLLDHYAGDTPIYAEGHMFESLQVHGILGDRLQRGRPTWAEGWDTEN